MEYLDVYDEEMTKIGVASRDVAHQQGLWHRTFHCWILSQTAGEWQLLFQKRHPAKDTNPNLFDVTAAGHLLAGEPIAAGVRELQEEIGVTAEFDDLAPVCEVRQSFQRDGLVDNEFCHVFALVRDDSLETYVLQTDEVVGLVWVNLTDVLALFRGAADSVNAEGFLVNPDGQRVPVAKPLGKQQFVPRPDELYVDVCSHLQSVVGAMPAQA